MLTIIRPRETHPKTTVRYRNPHTSRAEVKKSDDATRWQGLGATGALTSAVNTKNDRRFGRLGSRTHLHGPVSPRAGIYPGHVKTCVHTQTSFLTDKNWKQSEQPPPREGASKTWEADNGGYAAVARDLEAITAREGSARRRPDVGPQALAALRPPT